MLAGAAKSGLPSLAGPCNGANCSSGLLPFLLRYRAVQLAPPSTLYGHGSHALFDVLAHVDRNGSVFGLPDPPALEGSALAQVLLTEVAVVLSIAEGQDIVYLHYDQSLQLFFNVQGEHGRVEARLAVLKAAGQVLLESASPMSWAIYQPINPRHQLYKLAGNHPRQATLGLPGVKLGSRSLQRVALHKCGLKIPARAWHAVARGQLQDNLQNLRAHCRGISLKITGIWVLITPHAPPRFEAWGFPYLLRGFVASNFSTVDHSAQLLSLLQLLEGLEGLGQRQYPRRRRPFYFRPLFGVGRAPGPLRPLLFGNVALGPRHC